MHRAISVESKSENNEMELCTELVYQINIKHRNSQLLMRLALVVKPYF